jgi:hypothetical protein
VPVCNSGSIFKVYLAQPGLKNSPREFVRNG